MTELSEDDGLNWTEWRYLAEKLAAETAKANGRARALVNAIDEHGDISILRLREVMVHLLAAVTIVENMEELAEQL